MQWLFIGIIILFTSLFFLHKQYHVAGFDYGKLVKYGEAIVENGEIFTTNYFSYSFPDYEFVNHHWGTGLVFYFAHRLGGFEALTILAFLLYITAFLFVFFLGKNISNTTTMLFFTLMVIPLLGTRDQPRPEAFSAVFFTLSMLILIRWHSNPQKYRRHIWLLPIIQLLWVNLHIFFFMGLFLQGTILLQLLIDREKRRVIQKFLLVIMASLLVCLINPNGIHGLLYPLNIMSEINYPVSENSAYDNFIRGLPKGGFVQYEVLFGLGLLGIVVWLRNRTFVRRNVYLLIWLVVFGLMTYWRIRAIALFSYVFLIFAATTVQQLWQGKSMRYKKGMNYFFSGLTIVSLLLIINLRPGWYNPYHYEKKPGLGIEKNLGGAAKAFKDYRLNGPIFNNFDIGDYLIYHLFPDEKVFIDARPEAYPPEFIQNTFLPALFDEQKWLRMNHE